MNNIYKTKLNHIDIIINIDCKERLKKEEKEMIYKKIFDDKNILWHNDYTPYEFMHDIKLDNNKMISDIKCNSLWGEINGRETRVKMNFNVKYRFIK